MLLILVVILAALAIWIASAYNGLVSLKNQVANAWKQIDVQLEATPRPHPQLGRDCQRRDAVREGDFGGGSQRSQSRSRSAGEQWSGSERRCDGRGRRGAERCVGPAPRSRGGLSRPQVDRERRATPRGADVDREQNRVRSPRCTTTPRRCTTPDSSNSRRFSSPAWQERPTPISGKSRTQASERTCGSTFR